ncbi:protoporphyrinogen oxidase HemJ [Salinispirillum marinum]|uniref:Protoporphyrinogen IX oxidase n=2 Tax=Saccharospirillaceae TaxID=255527 RepID=A0ABV8BF82_9GAMM
MLYLVLKSLHIIAVISWFAGLFYLPRLFVYHAQTEDQLGHERFVVMERKLYRGIMTPAMIVTLVLGFWMLWLVPMWWTQGWMHAKLALVAVLVGYHHICLAHLKRFARGQNSKSHVYFRWFNEVPLLPLLGIVFLVVLKPF